jgi:hypothetical protein
MTKKNKRSTKTKDGGDLRAMHHDAGVDKTHAVADEDIESNDLFEMELPDDDDLGEPDINALVEQESELDNDSAVNM